MTLGDWITWLTFAGGAFALARIAVRRYGPALRSLLSSLSYDAPREIMSRTPEPEQNTTAGPRTDDPTDGRTEPPAPILIPATLDSAKSLRAHGYTREDARAFLKMHGYSLGNDTWAAAKPPPVAPDDELVTPYAGRVTKKSYYPEQPELEYQEPRT